MVKGANKIIFIDLKKRLEKAKGPWADELHVVLWAYHSTLHSSTQEILYKLVFRADAVIPIELSEPSLRIITMAEESNENARRVELDLAEEDRKKAKIKEEAIKQQMASKYSREVHLQEFEEGDLDLRKVELFRKSQEEGKLAPNWEGPYWVIRKIGRGAYKIAELR